MFEKKIDAYKAHVYTALYDMCQLVLTESRWTYIHDLTLVLPLASCCLV